MTKWNTQEFFCLLVDPTDIRKLVCIQNEIKREKQLYKRTNCALQVLPLLHSLRVENWLSHFHCDLTWRNPV